jgi:hypothetical protein
MPGESASGPAPRTGVPVRLLRYLQRAVLDALMALAAIVLERRIRRALRGAGGTGPEPTGGQEG